MNGSVIKQFKNTNWKYTLYRMSVFAIFAYFFLKMVFFAVSIGQGIPPDEITHFGRVSAFSKSLFIPHDSPLTYEYGIMKGQPYLYYWVMGKILKLNIFKIDDLVFLRLCNALIGLLTVIVSFLWFRMISGNYLTLLLFLVLLTNTLMFTFICSSVSYDNLTNLASIFSVYLLSKQ